MPCRTDDYPDPSKSVYTHEKEIQKLTRLLCRACKALDENKVEIPTKALKTWWKTHNKADIKRRALAKLTPAERKALGH